MVETLTTELLTGGYLTTSTQGMALLILSSIILGEIGYQWSARNEYKKHPYAQVPSLGTILANKLAATFLVVVGEIALLIVFGFVYNLVGSILNTILFVMGIPVAGYLWAKSNQALMGKWKVEAQPKAEERIVLNARQRKIRKQV
jgi:hypothetical protein